jgi:predicted small secreted protein
MKMWKTIFALFGAVVLLCACNTVRGVGQDIEKSGEAIQKAATK